MQVWVNTKYPYLEIHEDGEKVDTKIKVFVINTDKKMGVPIYTSLTTYKSLRGNGWERVKELKGIIGNEK